MAVLVLSSIICLLSSTANAQQKITASITITNATTNGMTFTYNGNTRTFMNNVFNSSTQVLTNSDGTGCGSKTNLLNQIYANPFPQTTVADTGSNSFNIVGNANLPVSFAMATGLGTVSYSTQTVAGVIFAQVPVSGLPTATARTNVASGIVGAANAAENTNSIDENSLAAAELLGTNKNSTVFGQMTLKNAGNLIWGIIWTTAISGCTSNLTNGVYYNATNVNPVLTNGVNYGNAFSSPGSGTFSEQFGNGAIASGTASYAAGPDGPTASGNVSIAIGDSAFANADSSMAVGSHATATGADASTFGSGAVASGFQSTSIGFGANSTATNSTALGFQAAASFANSTAIGEGATTTGTNQVMLGSPGSSVVVPNNLTVGTNLVVNGGATILGPQSNGAFSGTNNFLANSDIAFVRKSISSLANGNNSGITIGTNVFCELSGPTGGFATAGFANGRDGKLIILLNQTGFAWTNMNESGTESIPANRIRTLTGADLILTNAAVTMVYNANVSRWIVVSHNP